MDKFKIDFDEDKYIGCQACESVRDNWVMKDNKAKLKKTIISEKELKSNKEAGEICHVNAIKIDG